MLNRGKVNVSVTLHMEDIGDSMHNKCALAHLELLTDIFYVNSRLPFRPGSVFVTCGQKRICQRRQPSSPWL